MTATGRPLEGLSTARTTPREVRAAPAGRAHRLATRRPLTVFFVLACMLSWWPAPLFTAGVSPTAAFAPGPFVAALVVLGLTEGRRGVSLLLRSMVRWRVPPRAYVAAVSIPVVISAVAVGANLALGAARPAADDLGAWTQVPQTFALILLVPLLGGGTLEEPGFRGFALGRLEQRFGAVAGPLVLGGLWVVWHGPLFLVGDIAWPDLIVIPAASIVIAEVFHLGRDSVLIAMVLHAMNNAVGGGYVSRLFHGADAVQANLLVAAGWTALAAGCAYTAGRRPLVPTKETP